MGHEKLPRVHRRSEGKLIHVEMELVRQYVFMYNTSSMVLSVESVFAPGDPQGFGLGLLGKNHFLEPGNSLFAKELRIILMMTKHL